MSKGSYKKFLKSVTLPHAKLGTIRKESEEAINLYNKYKNYLPMIYQGPTNRTERYAIYDGMQQDPTINWSLDIISDFITQSDEDLPFHIEYDDNEDLPESQTSILEQALKNWCDENEWTKRIYNTVRDILVYGDVVFIRDPETFELQKVNIYDVLGVVADELKNPTHYIIRNVELNVPLKVATQSKDDVTTQNMLNTINTNFSAGSYLQGSKNLSNDPTNDQTTLPVDAKHIMHISLNVDNMFLYPFGLSTLEKVYKVYIQKMLLQDCVLLYRIKNATEKLVFNIPVGNIPKYKRKQYMEKIRNEMYQRRMPSKDSDGVFNTIDVAYNSIPLCEDFYLPVDGDGIQPKIEKLAAGQNLGEIKDLTLWENDLIRGMEVPQCWVPYGTSDDSGSRNVPTNLANTYVQELRFYNYCKRLQNIMIKPFDKEFKRYLSDKGFLTGNTSFDLAFNDPTSIVDLTKAEIEANNLNTFSTAAGLPYISKQFALKKYLKLTEDEFNENKRLLILEQQDRFKSMDVKLPTEDSLQIPGLRSVDIDDIPMSYTEQLQGMNDMAGGMGGMPMGGDMSGGEMGGDMSGGMGAMGGADMSGGIGGADMGAGGMTGGEM
jgi:hypothetical protein